MNSPGAGFDSNGYKMTYYSYYIYLDISQFLDYVGTSNSNLPMISLPNFTDEQYQIMPNSFYNMIHNYNSYYSPIKTGHNLYGDSYIFPHRHIFNNTMGYYGNDYSYLGVLEVAPAVSLGDTYESFSDTYDVLIEREFKNIEPDTTFYQTVYNLFNPYEFFFIVPLTSSSIFTQMPKQFGGTQTKLIKQDVTYKIYKFKLIGHSQYSQYFDNLNYKFQLISNDDNKPKLKKCCLLNCMKKQK